MLDMNNNGEEMEHTTLSTTEKRDYDSDLLHRKLKIYKKITRVLELLTSLYPILARVLELCTIFCFSILSPLCPILKRVLELLCSLCPILTRVKY